MKSKRDRRVPAFHSWFYLRGLSEVAMFPTEAELFHALGSVHVLFDKKYHHALFVSPIIIPVLVVNIGWAWVAGVLGVGKQPAMLILALVSLSATLLIIRWIYRQIVVKHLRVELRRLGVPVCLSCGYDLTGNVTGVCSECAEKVEAS